MTMEKYINKHSDPEDEILIELTRETNLKVPGSRMLSGYMQGKVIEHISKMIKPEKLKITRNEFVQKLMHSVI